MSRGTQGTRRSQHDVVYGAVTLFGRSFQTVRLPHWFLTPCDGPYNPGVQAHRFGLCPRSLAATGGITDLFSFPAGTEMVHFPALPSTDLWIQSGIPPHDQGWVAPFGNLRVKACLRLTEAYRSLPRPSSTSSAKAFTVRP